jgi:hypothetical protein
MQVTTHQAGLDSSIARLALAQRIALGALAIFPMLNAVTPFITPDPPWLANLPLVVAIMAFLLTFGLSHIRAERARAVKTVGPKAKQVRELGLGAPILSAEEKNSTPSLIETPRCPRSRFRSQGRPRP